MPATPWDEEAIPILWIECRRKAPECTAAVILEQVHDKLKMKSWARIQNPVGFLLTSVPSAVQARVSASKRREQARAEGEIASAKREAQLRLRQEQELTAWKLPEEAFEALSQDKKQYLVNQERRRLLREHPEYADRAHLPGWEQSFRSRVIRALLSHTGPPAHEFQFAFT